MSGARFIAFYVLMGGVGGLAVGYGIGSAILAIFDLLVSL